MPVFIELPQVGESVTEGIIGKWLKQEGDSVEEYEPLVEVVTDKAVSYTHLTLPTNREV